MKFDKLHAQTRDDASLHADLVNWCANNSDVQFSSVRPEVHTLRYRTVETFLRSGTPLDRLHFFQPLIERSNVTLVDVSHMRMYIPQIESREFDLLKSEVRDRFVSIAFDGTSRLGEAINLTCRWCSDDFRICQRLVRFATTMLHMNSSQLATLITMTILAELGVTPTNVVCITRDSASVNGMPHSRHIALHRERVYVVHVPHLEQHGTAPQL